MVYDERVIGTKIEDITKDKSPTKEALPKAPVSAGDDELDIDAI